MTGNRNRDRGVARHVGSQIEKCTTKHVRERTNVRKLEYIRKGGYKQRFTDVDTDMDMDMDSISSEILPAESHQTEIHLYR